MSQLQIFGVALFRHCWGDAQTLAAQSNATKMSAGLEVLSRTTIQTGGGMCEAISARQVGHSHSIPLALSIWRLHVNATEPPGEAKAMRWYLIVFTLLVGAGSAAAQDNLLAAGKFEFYRCEGCHNRTATATVVKKGPHLHNLFGRKPGSLPNFKYSEAMVAFGRNKVWDETTLAAFLRDPRGTVPGNKMVTADNAMDFVGIETDEEVRALLAYLATLDPDGMAPQ